MPSASPSQHTAGDILRGAGRIYLRHFSIFILIYCLPVALVVVLVGEAARRTENPGLLVIGLILMIAVGLFASAAMLIAASDACLGNVPSFKRSYSMVTGMVALRFLATNLVQFLAVGLGLALLIVPGLIVALWTVVCQPVMLLEGKVGVPALKRSKQLADGSHWRNARVVLLLFVIVAVVSGVGGLAFAFLFPGLLDHWLNRAVRTVLAEGFTAPMVFITQTLLYYDQRVHKEGFDAKSVAEYLTR